MKKFVIPFAAAMLVASTGLASAAERVATFKIKNMSCAACPFIVKKSMAGVPGVISVKVSYADKRATVRYDDSKTKPQTIGAASTDAGFPATSIEPAS